ncbi:hypothetical protein KGF54_000957 [Candida jiufengensis]|uniref:uncharacterized protein n=1 Tax=Candida jiufengensis TaxID=497108 RepID=UPI00222578CF|nr:uncharacterized protein KGF54_000957 [Candida jiufengensis]KAI5956482.1 hypothetical protein KGF54_000957 [Candida jiufengensis]
MQFSTITFALIASFVAADVSTVTVESETLVTITSCGPEKTECPASSLLQSSSAANNSIPIGVSTFEGAGVKNVAYGAGAVAVAALLL